MKIVFLSHTPLNSVFKVGSYHLYNELNKRHYDVFHISKKNIWKVFTIKNVDIVLIDQQLFAPFLFLFNSAKIIYRSTDIVITKLKKYSEKIILHKANGIVATSNTIFNSFNSNKRKIVLENGVSDIFFENKINKKSENRNGAVYIGAIDNRFDVDSVVELANNNKRETFDIYGPVKILLPKNINKVKNLHFNGPIKFEKVPMVLNKYKVGLLPFSNHAMNKSRSPMKLYEYLASGLYVFNTNSSNKHINSNLIFSVKKDNIKNLFSKKSINTSGILESKKHKWSSITDKLLKFIQQN